MRSSWRAASMTRRAVAGGRCRARSARGPPSPRRPRRAAPRPPDPPCLDPRASSASLRPVHQAPSSAECKPTQAQPPARGSVPAVQSPDRLQKMVTGHLGTHSSRCNIDAPFEAATLHGTRTDLKLPGGSLDADLQRHCPRARPTEPLAAVVIQCLEIEPSLAPRLLQRRDRREFGSKVAAVSGIAPQPG